MFLAYGLAYGNRGDATSQTFLPYVGLVRFFTPFYRQHHGVAPATVDMHVLDVRLKMRQWLRRCVQ